MKKVLLGDIVDINPESITKDYPHSEIYYLDTASVTKNEFLELQKIKASKAPSRAKRIIRHGDVVYSTVRPNLKHYGIVKNPAENSIASTGFAVIRARQSVDFTYLYYWLTSSERTEYLTAIAESQTSTFPAFNPSVIEGMEINLPPIKTQKKIADILGSLDEKIELNRRMNETLEQIGQALFRHYFVDNPEREKWNMRELGEFFPVRTGKKDANFSSEDGKYPFFTCSQVVSKAPDFSFDCSAIILAGNGDFNIKYYKGKFEAYQRTYVLSPDKEEFLGFLYFLMKRDLKKITGGSRGSVIKFITKGMIENYKVRLPDDNNILILCIEFNSILDKISQNNIEIATLIKVRDSLLPKLISGEISV